MPLLQPGQSTKFVSDHYMLPLSLDDAPTQAWDLQVILLSTETGERLPVYSEEEPCRHVVSLQRYVYRVQPVVLLFGVHSSRTNTVPAELLL
jgi:hypothetical protein